MKKIIPDTNTWMALAEFHLDLLQEVKAACEFPAKVYVLTGIIDELHHIGQKQRGRHQQAASLALQLLQLWQIPTLSSKGKVDDELARLSQEGDVVITQDRGLKRRLSKPYLTIRQKKRLIMVE